MILEGKHAELGMGIYISDIQEGSPAEQVIIVTVSVEIILRGFFGCFLYKKKKPIDPRHFSCANICHEIIKKPLYLPPSGIRWNLFYKNSYTEHVYSSFAGGFDRR